MEQQIENIDLNNSELKNAVQLIQFTNRSVYLTGKAGTGKSTFLRYIASTIKKKHIILAPTGIAAINVGGVTLHSFFKLPFHPLLPNDVKYSKRNIRETLKYNGEKKKIIRELELIIIDEISMVRADIIDFIDKVLRIYSRNMREPFGGKQLLLVGDIFQLEPVIKEDDRKLLNPFYPSNYFFDAKVFREMQLVSIELKKVYRQSDPVFLNILDHIRIGSVTSTDLNLLNKRLNAKLSTTDDKMSITLSTHRNTVDFINERQLNLLEGNQTTFIGEINGEFPENNLPNSIKLDVKIGAQIIFIKNDIDKRWVNGTLGTIIGIDEENEKIYIHTENGEEYDVEKDRWSNMHYTFNEKEQKIEEEEIGTFIQFPIKLAWAITIHKSQGLTFRFVNIDFSGGVFAGGQAYVALSRCTSLEGISLKEPIRSEEIFVKTEIKNFARNFNNKSIMNNALIESKADKEYFDAVKAFDKGDFDEFLSFFFKAIHSRYDIEKPIIKRFIRRKLNVINILKKENEQLIKEKHEKERFLKKLSAEYTLLGKECEKDNVTKAAIANYKKALELYPSNPDAKRRLNKLQKK